MSRAAAALVAVLALSCASGGSASAPSGAVERPRCLPSGTGLRGWVLLGSREFRFPDHTGVRVRFRDPDGRRLYFLLGIPGEVGEGLPFVGRRELVDGSSGRLLGEEDTWVLAWAGRVPCQDMAIVGNKISRRAFETALRGANILP